MRCIVGCDPDVGGALAVITFDDVGNVDTVMIFDCPTKPVDVNGKARTRVCVDGMVKLVRELDLPAGTVAHLEVGGGRSLYASQSCFVQGAASGQWLGVLVSHGLDVRLVAASTWKWALKLARRGQMRDKNASRELAKRWFANESNQVADALKRVKDHGRAEALLIAAHGHWAEGAKGIAVLPLFPIFRQFFHFHENPSSSVISGTFSRENRFPQKRQKRPKIAKHTKHEPLPKRDAIFATFP